MFSDKELILKPDEKSLKIKVSGEGKKGIFLYVTHESEIESLILFLSKILEALKIDLEKDTYLSILKPEDNLSFFQTFRKPKHIFLFGTKPNQLGLNVNFNPYRVVQVNGVKVLKSDTLSSIQKDEKLKRLLWNCLKEWQG